MDAIEKLVAIEDIRQLKSSYFRALDTKDWVLMREIFSESPAADYRGAVDEDPEAGGATIANAVNSQVLTTRDMIVDGLRGALAGSKSLHLGVNPEITFLPDGTAKGVWAMEDWLWFEGTSPKTRLRGHGHYHNTFTKEGGRWRIKTLRLTRVNVQISHYD